MTISTRNAGGMGNSGRAHFSNTSSSYNMYDVLRDEENEDEVPTNDSDKANKEETDNGTKSCLIRVHTHIRQRRNSSKASKNTSITSIHIPSKTRSTMAPKTKDSTKAIVHSAVASKPEKPTLESKMKTKKPEQDESGKRYPTRSHKKLQLQLSKDTQNHTSKNPSRKTPRPIQSWWWGSHTYESSEPIRK